MGITALRNHFIARVQHFFGFRWHYRHANEVKQHQVFFQQFYSSTYNITSEWTTSSSIELPRRYISNWKDCRLELDIQNLSCISQEQEQYLTVTTSYCPLFFCCQTLVTIRFVWYLFWGFASICFGERLVCLSTPINSL